MKDETLNFYPQSRQEWRQWLQENHQSRESVWLVCYKQKSGKPTISWSDSVDEALCFGWIDSTRKSDGDDRFVQFFTRRKPKSVWSKINKDKVQRLTEEGLMTPAGQACIDIAQQNGSWSSLDAVEALEIPADLEKAFKSHRGMKTYFLSLSKSVKKLMLYRLALAKRPETRQSRIGEIIAVISENQKTAK